MMLILRRIKNRLFILLDRLFLKLDKKYILRSKNILLIPTFLHRVGGKISYAEWAHVIGIFQTLIVQNSKASPKILDVGCGTGLLAIAAFNSISKDGSYTGIDVSYRDINFNRRHFPVDKYNFIHLQAHNAMYAQDQLQNQISWNLPDNSFDLIVSLSVWTHFNENDAFFYMKEASRVLKKNGRAIISFFIKDEIYEEFEAGKNKFDPLHNTPYVEWIFDKNAYSSQEWFTTDWAKNPEEAIAVSEKGLFRLLESAGFKVIEKHPGTWKGYPGLYFQDILILEKN